MREFLSEDKETSEIYDVFSNLICECDLITEASLENIRVLQWLLDNQEKLELAHDFWNQYEDGEGGNIAHVAVRAGNILVLQWLLDNQERLRLAKGFWDEKCGGVILDEHEYDVQETVTSILERSGKFAESVGMLILKSTPLFP